MHYKVLIIVINVNDASYKEFLLIKMKYQFIKTIYVYAISLQIYINL